MCLGSRTSKPQLQQRTLPAEGTRPADESTKKATGSPQTARSTPKGGVWDYHPGALASRAEKEWAEKGHLDDVPNMQRNDQGINV